MNPYNWKRHSPRVEVVRRQRTHALEELARGGSAVVVGGHGMGKSVFLGQLRKAMEESPDVHVVLIPAPPPDFTVQACLKTLARELGVAVPDPLDTRQLFEAYLGREDAPSQLVLLYDEFDRFAQLRKTTPWESVGRRFFNDLEASRRSLPGIGLLAAGSIGVFVFRDLLGSPFLSRAEWIWLSSFERDDVETLAIPFAERGEALTMEALEALYLATGGNPALVTYGLQEIGKRRLPQPGTSPRSSFVSKRAMASICVTFAGLSPSRVCLRLPSGSSTWFPAPTAPCRTRS